jgi:hypothetical protein
VEIDEERAATLLICSGRTHARMKEEARQRNAMHRIRSREGGAGCLPGKEGISGSAMNRGGRRDAEGGIDGGSGRGCCGENEMVQEPS